MTQDEAATNGRSATPARLIALVAAMLLVALTGCDTNNGTSAAGTQPATSDTTASTATVPPSTSSPTTTTSQPATTAPPSSTTTTTARPSTTNPPTSAAPPATDLPEGAVVVGAPGSDELAAELAVFAYWDAYQRASAEPVDPNDPALAATVVDPLRTTVVQNITELVENGWAVRAAVPVAVDLSVEVDGDTAVVTQCRLDQGVVYEVSSGEVINDAVETRTWRLTLQRDGGQGWVVAENETIDRVDGAGGCLQQAG